MEADGHQRNQEVSIHKINAIKEQAIALDSQEV
jgi:hypothetical protein